MESKLPEELIPSVLPDQAATAITRLSEASTTAPVPPAANVAQMQRMQLAMLRDLAEEPVVPMTAIVLDSPRAPISPLIRQLQKRKQPPSKPQLEDDNADMLSPSKRMRAAQLTDSDQDDIIVLSRSTDRQRETVTSTFNPASARSAASAAAAAATDPPAAAAAVVPRFQFVSASVAAKQIGLPKAIVKSWAAQGLIDTLKPGSDASHRLIDVLDLARFVEMKRERASGHTRVQVEQEFEQQLRGLNTLLYVRHPPPANLLLDDMSEEEITLHSKPLESMAAKMRNLLHLDPNVCFSLSELVADNEDLDRIGFENIMMRLVLRRKIERLVISNREQVCSAAVWPLFEWICKQHDVSIVLASMPSARPSAGASASAEA